MRTSKRSLFQTVKTEGGILPADLLQAISDRKSTLKGLTEDDYHLSGIKLTEAIGQSWNRLSGSWKAFQSALEKLPDSDPATTVTREKWLLPLFEELRYGRLPIARAEEIDGKIYSMSHVWEYVPFLLIGCRVDIEKRAQVVGAWHGSPHGQLQEYLNHCPEKLWGFVSNGYKLRILRDNLSLTRQAYVEFDLSAMFEGECYADFVILWLLCHESRVETPLDANQKPIPSQCWLEKWSQAAQDEGTRALEDLRKGVEEAINAIGGGFLAHPANKELLRQLRSGELDKQEYYRQLLRIIYRLIFLFVVEDRDLLVPADRQAQAKQRYYDFYSVSRLRTLAEKRASSQHSDQWCGLNLIFDKLGSRDGCLRLGLPPLGSFLWSQEAIKNLADCELSNAFLLRAIYFLSFISRDSVRMYVDYRNLGAEELGSIYEALLEMHPVLDLEAGSFLLNTAAGNERKTTGSYYTPTCLVNCLLDSALEPVIAERLEIARKLTGKVNGVFGDNLASESQEYPDWVYAAQREFPKDELLPYQTLAEKALLSLKICDPACGSGHFLIAAAHRTAKRLAAVRTGDAEPSPEATRKALRDVISHCLYGVDINPMSVELCKVSLWVEAVEPGKPLSFLDHHIKCGNSLIGATPEAIAAGIPDDAYSPIEGDDKKACSDLKKQNKADLKAGGHDFFSHDGETVVIPGNLAATAAVIDDIADDSIAALEQKQDAYRDLTASETSAHAHFIADLWCAAFVWKKKLDMAPGTAAPTTATLRQVETIHQSVSVQFREMVTRYAEQYKFFHWYLEFPSVFKEKTSGFDVILGNPPWERVKLQEKEFFAKRDPNIAHAPNAATRKKLIAALVSDNPALLQSFKDELRQAEGESHILRNSGIYPLCGRGDVNLYAVFAELVSRIVGQFGRFGAIFPSGIATDDTTKFYFQNIIETQSLVSLYDFENREKLFPAVDSRMKFCLLTGGAKKAAQSANFVFFALATDELLNPEKRFSLSPEDITLLNPNTHTCPVFRSNRDAMLILYMYQNAPSLCNSTIKYSFSPKIDMSEEVDVFIRIDDYSKVNDASVLAFFNINIEYVRLYESKLIWHYDHRFGTFDKCTSDELTSGQNKNLCAHEKMQANQYAMPRYFLPAQLVNKRYNYEKNINQSALAVRRLTNATNERTAIFTVVPYVGCGNSMFVFNLPSIKHKVWILACGNSIPFDYIVRNKLGGTNFLQFVIEQIAIVCEHNAEKTLGINFSFYNAFLLPRAMELTYTAWDLEPFAKDYGYDGPPFKWDEERRFLLRCELDAAFFRLYLPADTNGDWKITRVSEGAVKDETPEEFAALKAAFPTPRDAVSYIMDTFPIAKRKDEAAYGTYRTKDTILNIYDMMQCAMATGTEYISLLNPLPGPPVDATGNFIPFENWDMNNYPPHIHKLHKKALPISENEQIFPWDGREQFVYRLIPHLVAMREKETFEYYQDAAILASRPENLKLLLSPASQEKFNALPEELLAKCSFPTTAKIRPQYLRKYLLKQEYVSVNPISGLSTDTLKNNLPQLDFEISQLLPFIYEAADILFEKQQDVLSSLQQTTIDSVRNNIRILEIA